MLDPEMRDTPHLPDGAPTSHAGSSYTGRRLGIELAIGLVLGFVAWMLVGPALISFWYKAPSGGLSCGPSVQEALSQFVRAELWAALVGAVGFVALLFAARRILKSSSSAGKS